MKSSGQEWLAGQPILLAILHCAPVRPPRKRRLPQGAPRQAANPRTDRCAHPARRRRLAARRRGACATCGCWRPADPLDPEALDAHPLVRESFGDRLRPDEPTRRGKTAHSRLYDHLRDTTHEGQTPTLADLAPLYHAIAHGCSAGRQLGGAGRSLYGAQCLPPATKRQTRIFIPYISRHIGQRFSRRLLGSLISLMRRRPRAYLRVAHASSARPSELRTASARTSARGTRGDARGLNL